MRIERDGVPELTYCTNIHPGESLDDVEDSIRSYTVSLKDRVAPDVPMGVGLRLSNEAAAELAGDEGRLDRFQALLDEHDLYVFTFNGFPYGGFHRRRVKDDVYRPDWRSDERLRYTERLIELLARLLPDGTEGSISTSPLSYKPWLEAVDAREAALLAGAERLASAAFVLFDVRERTGRLIHLGIEPEPDCLIENTAETVSFFEEWLLRTGANHLRKEHGLRAAQAEDVLREHIRVCYDTCHFAVEYEKADVVLPAFKSAGIRLSKLQISSALRVPLQGAPPPDLAGAREPFAESTALHQVVARSGDGTLHRYRDLPEALQELEDERADEWRIHYHVPIFISRFNDLHSTQDDILPAVEGVLRDGSCRHLEIETYTWDVLPDDLKTDVVSSLEREFNWLLGHITPID